MSAEAALQPAPHQPRPPLARAAVRAAFENPRTDPRWVRWGLTSFAVIVVGVLVVVPVVNIFYEALKEGVRVYWDNLFNDPDTRASIVLTATVVPIALVANIVFGIAAAWAIARFKFPGRTLLTALIDLPFSVSPVVAGLMFVLIFGLQGYLGRFLREDGYSIMPYLTSLVGVFVLIVLYFLFRPSNPTARQGAWRGPAWLVVPAGTLVLFTSSVFIQKGLGVWPQNESLKIIFATPGLVLATAFVTFPFVARELIPIMEAVGAEEELAAINLGANGWQMFWDITTPNIKWGLVYGIILCNARAIGEFGAVYVVSGHIAGQTDTMPLRIEKLFQEYNLPGCFAVASVLTLLAIVTLIAKAKLERKIPSVVHAPTDGEGTS
jgi:sulfate transport system permease protein